MKKIFHSLLVIMFAGSSVFAQGDFCTQLADIMSFQPENFRPMKGAEKGRKRDIANKEVITYATTSTITGFEEPEIRNDYDWYWTARYAGLTDNETAADNFKKVNDMVKPCLVGWSFKQMDKNPSDTYDLRGAYAAKGAESATVNVYIYKSKEGKFFVQLSVKGTKKPY